MPVIEAQCASILVPHDHRHINQIRTSKEPGEEAGACQMDLICAPQLMSAKAGWPDQKEVALRAFFRCSCVTQRDARVVARTF